MTTNVSSARLRGTLSVTPSPKIPLGEFIGRFNLLHRGQLGAMIEGASRVDFLNILLGSAFQPRTYFNPFYWNERAEMIMLSLPEEIRDRVLCLPLEDYAYNNTAWLLGAAEQSAVARRHFGLPDDAKTGLVGHRKDGTSFYLDMFPQWEEIAVANTTKLSSTTMREKFFLTDEPLDPAQVPEPVIDWLTKFREEKPEDFQRIRDEYLHVQKVKEPYKHLKFPPIFVTVDSCVVQAGHVLLVQRKGMPGRGLWAMPGGFLNADERIEDAIYRELEEETKIEVAEAVLRGRTQEIKVFDSVHRSSRGRTITHAALIALETPPSKPGERTRLPRVKGSDDAKRAKWFPLKGAGAITREMMFEDHFDIIANLTAKLN